MDGKSDQSGVKARESIQVSLEDFLMELRRMLGPEARRVTGQMFTGILIPEELANWAIGSIDKFLGSASGNEPSEDF